MWRLLRTTLLLLAHVASAGLKEVVELSVEDFDQTSEGLWLVEFYAP